MLKLNLLTAVAFRLIHEDPPVVDDPIEDEEAEAKAAAEAAKKNKKPQLKVPFSDEQQAFVNSLLAEESRKSKVANGKLVTQLETIKNSANTTAAEKEALETRIEDIKNSQLTADELRKKETKKERQKWETEAAASKTEAEKWKSLYTTSTIQRSIIDAATAPGTKAYNPRHIVSLLTPDTRLVEELDDDGKPTGELIPKVRVRTIKDGKPTTLEMAVTEAVKFLSEQDEHAPLFDSGAAGGLGGNPNNPRRKSGDPDEVPTDPAEYRVWRAKNPDKVGARPSRGKK